MEERVAFRQQLVIRDRADSLAAWALAVLNVDHKDVAIVFRHGGLGLFRQLRVHKEGLRLTVPEDVCNRGCVQARVVGV